MTTQHTPGPWIAVGTWVEHPDDNTPDICNCNPFHMMPTSRSHEEACANARLIAAAPELLAALQACDKAMSYMSEYDIPLTLPEQVKAAIAKATGEPQ